MCTSPKLNVRNQPVAAVRLFNQVPVAAGSVARVKVLGTGGAQLDDRSGQLTWLLRLPAGASQRRRFSFQVDYLKDKTVEIINHRVRTSNPKFRN